MESADLVEEVTNTLLEEPSGGSEYWTGRKARDKKRAAFNAEMAAKRAADPELQRIFDQRQREFRAAQDAAHANDVVDTRGDW